MNKGNTGKRKRKPAQILEAVKGSGGICSKIAKRLGIDRRTLYKYRQEWPEIEEAIHEAEDEGLDMAESQLMNLVAMGDLKAIMYYLDNKGKKRGWGQSKDIKLESSMPIQPIICFGDENDADHPDTAEKD